MASKDPNDKRLSRRDLFSLFRRPLEAAVKKEADPEPPVARATQRLPPPLRPPGAAPELVLADTCTRCGACVAACPRQAIHPLPATYGAWAGTPYLVPRHAPCVVCNGLLCTTVCPSGSLRPLASPAEIQMGMAEINQETCLAYPKEGQPPSSCSACVDHCPIPSAIVLTEGRPQTTTSCVGCGLCENYCPTKPSSIQVRPREADFW